MRPEARLFRRHVHSICVSQTRPHLYPALTQTKPPSPSLHSLHSLSTSRHPLTQPIPPSGTSLHAASLPRRPAAATPPSRTIPFQARPSSTSTPPPKMPPSSALTLPPSSWDSHMHVVDPTTYALSPTATYTPHPHTLSDALTFYASLSPNLTNMVFVQPSIYGHDNSCLLDALRALGPGRGRGVVCFDPKTVTQETLAEWHALGVRGVRLNLVSEGRAMGREELEEVLGGYARVIRGLGWVLQLYVPLGMADELVGIVGGLGVKVCLDHFGQPALGEGKGGVWDPYEVEGFGSLVEMLKGGSTYVKVSAPYRISKVEGGADLEPLGRELVRVAGRERLVFATDWPHTRFDGVDIRPFVQTVLEWCDGDQELADRIFRGNAEDLWDVKR